MVRHLGTQSHSGADRRKDSDRCRTRAGQPGRARAAHYGRQRADGRQGRGFFQVRAPGDRRQRAHRRGGRDQAAVKLQPVAGP